RTFGRLFVPLRVQPVGFVQRPLRDAGARLEGAGIGQEGRYRVLFLAVVLGRLQDGRRSRQSGSATSALLPVQTPAHGPGENPRQLGAQLVAQSLVLVPLRNGDGE